MAVVIVGSTHSTAYFILVTTEACHGNSLLNERRQQKLICGTMDYWSAIYLFILILILASSKSATSKYLSKRESRCPIYTSPDWTTQDNQCSSGTRYHCIEDGNNNIVIYGCYKVKNCRKGAHPALVEEELICQLCATGFQPVDSKASNTFSLSYCDRHSQDCNPEDGQSECRPATEVIDRGCMCNSTLGYKLNYSNFDSCECFSKQDTCLCEFIGCPSGFAKNNRGFCEPDTRTTTVSSNTSQISTIDDPSSKSDNLEIILPVVLGVVVFAASLTVYFCCKRKQKRKNISESIADSISALKKTEDISEDISDTANELKKKEEIPNMIVSGDVYLIVDTANNVAMTGKEVSVNVRKATGPLGMGETTFLTEKEAKKNSDENDRTEFAKDLTGEEMKATPAAVEVISPSIQDSATCRPSQEEQVGSAILTPAHPTDSQRIRENYQPTPDINDEAVHPEPSAPCESLPVPTAPYLSLPVEDKEAESDESLTEVKELSDTRALNEEFETSVQNEDRRAETEEEETPHPTAGPVACYQQTDLQGDEENDAREESPLLGVQNTSQAAINQNAGVNRHTDQTINVESLQIKKSDAQRKAKGKVKSKKAKNKQSAPQLACA